jgi:hypothetical protein
MAVKHTDPDNNETTVHKGTKGGTTACGKDTTLHPTHWVATTDTITCKRTECKS